MLGRFGRGTDWFGRSMKILGIGLKLRGNSVEYFIGGARHVN